MPFVIVNIASEYLPDGSFHVYSPDVPGFHVVDGDHNRPRVEVFYNTALPILEDTLRQRIVQAQAGERIRFNHEMRIAHVESFVPAQLRLLRADSRPEIPRQLIAEIS
jgi:hypothetical protein